MVKILNLFGDSYSGQAGKAGVFAKWKGRQYRRKYVIPANPKSAMQQTVRGYFTNAVAWWHLRSSLMRLAFSYLATGLVMSGFNLLVSRWQKKATTGATLPLVPKEGIKQIGTAPTSRSNTGLQGSNPFTLTYGPVKIGSLAYTPLGSDGDTINMDAYVDLEMGDVRIPTQLTKTGGLKGTGQTLATGDKLLISYTSGGRTITKEELYECVGANIPAKASIDVALRTAYWPIDLQSVVIQIEDVSESPHTFTQLESLEIKNCHYTMSDTTVTFHPDIYFDLTPPANAASKVDYTSYTKIQGAKLEVTKVDTSFVTWRAYSDVPGQIPIAQTIEDETYDFRLSAPGYVDIIRAAQSAVLATKHELVVMTAV